MYTLNIADLIIEILGDNKTNTLFNDYLVDTNNKADITIELDEGKDVLIDVQDKLGKNIIKYNGFFIHGACILYEDNAYLFIAPSGTGKTTHILLWKKHIKDLIAINGDKPIIRLKNNIPIIYGTPWNGKERFGKNISGRLKSIVILSQGQIDKIEKVDKKDYIKKILNQIYIPDDTSALIQTMDLVDKVFDSVDIYTLSCTMNDSAFEKCYEGLIGRKYENK